MPKQLKKRQVNRQIDHLVYCVPDLREGMKAIESKFGVAPVYGGRHINQGTHNALIYLGTDCYFEILAVDPDSQIQPPRWMGIDLIKEPKLTRWAVSTSDFEGDLKRLKRINPHLAKATKGSRKTTNGNLLQWQMTLPLPTPEIEITPFLLDWGDSIHPSVSLDAKCQLIELHLTHPQPDLFSFFTENWNLNLQMKKGKTMKINAKVETPKGIVLI